MQTTVNRTLSIQAIEFRKVLSYTGASQKCSLIMPIASEKHKSDMKQNVMAQWTSIQLAHTQGEVTSNLLPYAPG
jgi:hypothetical protein